MPSTIPTVLVDPALLAREIEHTLNEDRKTLLADADADPDHALTPEQTRKRERTVMFDVTIALMIRYRLSIDADAARRAVHEAAAAAAFEATVWARACAEYVAGLAG